MISQTCCSPATITVQRKKEDVHSDTYSWKTHTSAPPLKRKGNCPTALIRHWFLSEQLLCTCICTAGMWITVNVNYTVCIISSTYEVSWFSDIMFCASCTPSCLSWSVNFIATLGRKHQLRTWTQMNQTALIMNDICLILSAGKLVSSKNISSKKIIILQKDFLPHNP